MATGLQKVVVEVPFKGGLLEKVTPEMAPPEGMYVLENVELNKVGSFQRRAGYEIMSSAALGPNSASSFGVPKKVAGRADELFVVSEDTGYFGSGGGSGASGSMLWSYSPESDAWRAHGKVPNCTAERMFGVMNSQAAPRGMATAYCYRTSAVTNAQNRYLILAYYQRSWAGSDPGVHVIVYDTTSRVVVHEDTIIDGSVSGEVQVMAVSVGRYAVISWRVMDAAVASNIAHKYVVYDAENPDFGFNTIQDLHGALNPIGGRGWTIATNGINVFFVSALGAASGGFADRDVVAYRTTIGFAGPVGFLSITGVKRMSNVGDGPAGAGHTYLGAYCAGGYLHTSWEGTGLNWPMYSSVDTGFGPLRGPVSLDVVTVGTVRHVLVAALDANNACVFWSGGTSPSQVFWRWVQWDGAALVTRASGPHKQPGMMMLTHPYVVNSRVYVGATGVGAGTADGVSAEDSHRSNLGHVVIEVNASTALEDTGVLGGNFITPMPVAHWSRDLSFNTGQPSIVSPSTDGSVYMCSAREARTTDAIFRESQDQKFPTAHEASIWAFDVMRVAYADPKRWQHAEVDGQTVIACGLPYCYDGDRAHECGFVHRPVIYQFTQSGTTFAFQAGDLPTYKLIYEWEDNSGRRWFSDPSYPAQIEIDANGRQVELTLRPPWLTVKPEGAFGFTGRVKMNLYRSMAAAPDDYVLIHSETHMIWGGLGLRDMAQVSFSDQGLDFSTTERAYIAGGELENHVAPTCRSLIQHRDRLFLIGLETNSLWYTKPFIRGRGIEWSRYQALALPQRGMALASIEGSLLVFTDKAILVLDGAGPSATGIPPDAFGRFAVLSQDQGCAEVNAAWRTPRGVVFRSHQGLWLVTPQLGVLYIGAAVESLVRTVDYFVDGAVDETNGCLRLLAKVGSGYRTLVYWYDSDRWSVDTHALEYAGTQYSSTFLLGEYYKATSVGVAKRNESLWKDGIETEAGHAYVSRLQTGWYRFDSLSAFKRLWRVIVNLASKYTLGTAKPQPELNLRLTVETGDDSSTFVFPATVFDSVSTVSWSLRAHLKYQKGQKYRVTLQEEPQAAGVAVGDGPPGFVYLGLGFELGMKRGAAKLGQERTR